MTIGSHTVVNLGLFESNYTEVATFAALPSAALFPGEVYLVKSPTGLMITLNLKRAGLYLSNGSVWTRLGTLQDQFSTSKFVIYDDADNTKKVLFDLTNISTGVTRTIIMPDNNADLTLLAQATESARGTAEILTQAEADTGADDLRILTALKAKNTRGTEEFFLTPQGSFGTGGGWADPAFLSLIPVLGFASNTTERAIYMFFTLTRIKIDAVDPQIGFIIYSTSAPNVGEAVRWQLSVKYKAETEDISGASDEVLLQTQVLATEAANSRQTTLFFTLDRTLISNQDVIHLNLERLGGDGADTYGSDIAVGQAGIIVETVKHNP